MVEQYKNIWNDGFEIERNGQKIALTKEEIREINDLFQAANGQGSLDFYINAYEEEEDFKDKVELADKFINDTEFCKNIWNNFLDYLFYDNSKMELDSVNDYLSEVLKKDAGSEQN